MVRKKSSSKIGAGCAALFAIPFAAFSVFMGWMLLSALIQHAAMQGWPETPARIAKAELKVESNDGVTYRVLAEYDYEFGGQPYHGSRVSLHDFSDNIGSFQQRAHQELAGYQSSGRLFRCYVNPDRPAESILYRDLRPEMIVVEDVVVLLFGGCGWGMLFGSLLLWRDQRKRAPLVEQYPDQPWYWRSDWEANEIQPNGTSLRTVFVFVALYWNLATAPLWWLLPAEILQGRMWAFLPMILPAIGLWLAIAATRSVLARRWLGRCRLCLQKVPTLIGTPLAGTIEIERALNAEEFSLKLTCVETTQKGDDTKTTDIWNEEQLVSPQSDSFSNPDIGTVIPVSFDLPDNSRPTSDGSIEWKLTLKSPELGRRFQLEFSVPVFGSLASPFPPVADRDAL